MKNCPLCEISLHPISLADGLELDLCTRCKGVWFDHKELDRTAVSAEHRTLLLDMSSSMPVTFKCKKCSQMNTRLTKSCIACSADMRLNCPQCSKELDQTNIGSIVTDRCPRCRGVWFDGGELEILFTEYQKHYIRQSSTGSSIVMAGIADATLETLIWAPELVLYGGVAAVKVAAELPGVLVHGADTAIQAASHLPDLASGVTQGGVELASHVADLSGDFIQGTAEIVSNIPDAAGNVADLFGSFIEFLFGLISD